MQARRWCEALGPGGVQIHTAHPSKQEMMPRNRWINWVPLPNGTLRNTATGDVKNAPTPAEVWVKQPDGTFVNQATGKPESAPTPAAMWVRTRTARIPT